MLFVQSGIFSEPCFVNHFTIIEGYECAVKVEKRGVIGNSALNEKVVQRMTDKDIQEAIENCFWRKDVAGIYVCSGDMVPCEKHIDDGKCDTLINLFRQEGDNHDD